MKYRFVNRTMDKISCLPEKTQRYKEYEYLPEKYLDILISHADIKIPKGQRFHLAPTNDMSWSTVRQKLNVLASVIHSTTGGAFSLALSEFRFWCWKLNAMEAQCHL